MRTKPAAAIVRFEASTGYRDFALFHIEQARRFKRQLTDEINPMMGKPLAKATVHSQLVATSKPPTAAPANG